MIKPKPLSKQLRSDDEYNKQYDELVEKEANRWEDILGDHAISPTQEEIQKTKAEMISGHRDWQFLARLNNAYLYQLRIRKSKNVVHEYLHLALKNEAARLLKECESKFTDEYVRSSLHKLYTIGGLAVSMAVKKTKDEKREKTIKQWKKEDKARDKKILSAIPFDNINCKKCKISLIYRWSMLSTLPDDPNGEKMVVFFYYCQNYCGNNELIFENGIPWNSEKSDNCAVCNGKRNSTTTQDNSGNLYIIYECSKCGSRQVEKIEKKKTD